MSHWQWRQHSLERCCTNNQMLQSTHDGIIAISLLFHHYHSQCRLDAIELSKLPGDRFLDLFHCISLNLRHDIVNAVNLVNLSDTVKFFQFINKRILTSKFGVHKNKSFWHACLIKSDV